MCGDIAAGHGVALDWSTAQVTAQLAYRLVLVQVRAAETGLPASCTPNEEGLSTGANRPICHSPAHPARTSRSAVQRVAPRARKHAGANLRRQTLISVVCQGLLRTHHSLTAKCDGQRLRSAADHGSHLAVLLHIDPDDAAARRRAAAAGQSGLPARTSRVGRPRPAAG